MRTKKGFILLCFILTFSSFGLLQAQEGLKIGVMAHPMTTYLVNPDDIDANLEDYSYETTFGMAAGPLIGYNFNDNIGFRTSFLYSVQGQKYTALNAQDDEILHTTRLHYLKIPLTVGFNTNTEYNKYIFYFHGGFQLNLLMKGKYYNDDQSYVPDPTFELQVSDYPNVWERYNFVDYGPVVETGLDIKLKYNLMGNIHVRADYGLNDAERKDVEYRLTTNGQTDVVKFWDQERSKTRNFTAGLVIGITYTFVPN